MSRSASRSFGSVIIFMYTHSATGFAGMKSMCGAAMRSGWSIPVSVATTASRISPGASAVVATETGMLYPLRMAAPHIDFIPANPVAECVYMKMITLPKVRDALRDMKFEVRVPEDVAARARVPIERMVAIV